MTTAFWARIGLGFFVLHKTRKKWRILVHGAWQGDLVLSGESALHWRHFAF